MYSIIENIFSFWRNFVLIILILICINSLMGYLSKKRFSTLNLRYNTFGLVISVIQLIIGIIFYLIINWLNEYSTDNLNYIKNSDYKLLSISGLLINLASVLFIFMGWSLHNRQFDSRKKFVRIFVFYGLGFLILIRTVSINQIN
jgi:hypothetical protein